MNMFLIQLNSLNLMGIFMHDITCIEDGNVVIFKLQLKILSDNFSLKLKFPLFENIIRYIRFENIRRHSKYLESYKRSTHRLIYV